MSPDIPKALSDYAARVAAAPLLTEAELHAKAFELLSKESSMIDACIHESVKSMAGMLEDLRDRRAQAQAGGCGVG